MVKQETIRSKSTQRVYNTFEKGQTLYPSPFPFPLFLPSSFSGTTFFPFHWEKRKNFALSCRILHWSLLPSSSPLSSLPFSHLPSRSFPMCCQNLEGIFYSKRTSSVPCKCRHKCNEASHVTPCY